MGTHTVIRGEAQSVDLKHLFGVARFVLILFKLGQHVNVVITVNVNQAPMSFN